MFSPRIHRNTDWYPEHLTLALKARGGLATGVSWAGGAGEAGETGQVVTSREIPSWFISHSSLFRITACSTGSFQPRATNLIYNVLNCFSFSSPPAGRWTCTIAEMLCVVLAGMIIEPTQWLQFLISTKKIQEAAFGLYLFIFSLSSCLSSEIISVTFCLLLLYGVLNSVS